MSTPPTTDRDDALDAVFGALAHRARRQILARLGRGSATVSELAEPLEMTAPAVSRHLKVLERAGLIRRRIDGRVHTCSFDPTTLRDAVAWMRRNHLFWTQAFDRLDRLVALDAATSSASPTGAAASNETDDDPRDPR